VFRLAVRHEERVIHLPLPASAATLGADPDNDLCLPFPGVSRHHLRLEKRDGGVLLTDLGSKNGLVRAGQRLPEVVLQPGEAIQVGRAWLRLEEVDSSDAEIALSLDGIRLSVPPRHSDATSQIAAESEATPEGSVVRVIRRLEREGADLRTAAGREALEAAVKALGATSLFVVRLGEAGPAIARTIGEMPGDELLADLARHCREAHDCPPEGIRLADGRRLLAQRLPGGKEPEYVAALLQSQAERPHAWQCDFFDYLVEKMAQLATRRSTQRRVPPPGPQDLVLPPEFVAGSSAALQGLLAHLRATVRSPLDIVLLGDTGTGKELFAKIVHLSGPSSVGPFVAINCAAIPADLLEAELFGVEARVATGVDPRPGLFVKAEGGSLFLDEIGDMPDPLQAKLLRALQEREVLPVGGHRPRKVKVRVISASNKNLPLLVQQGRFRADLFYRLRGLQFHLPPLSERPEDIPPLLLAFAERAARDYGKQIAGVSRKALDLLMAYDWPGNVRELKSEVERAVLLCADGDALTSDHFGPVRWALEHRLVPLPAEPKAAPEPEPLAVIPLIEDLPTPAPSAPRTLQDELDELERRLIVEAFEAARHNKSVTAQRLGVTRNGLAIKMKRLGIH
jgi:two-component system response regulator PilR (NtrC family)